MFDNIFQQKITLKQLFKAQISGGRAEFIGVVGASEADETVRLGEAQEQRLHLSRSSQRWIFSFALLLLLLLLLLLVVLLLLLLLFLFVIVMYRWCFFFFFFLELTLDASEHFKLRNDN